MSLYLLRSLIMGSNLVVKTNQLNSAVQNLSLAEVHIIQIGIVDAREKGEGLSIDKPLRIEAKRYAEVFNTTIQNAYSRLKEAEESLFNRRFSFIDIDGKLVKSRWIQDVRYLDNEGAIEIAFTRVVVNAITRIDGKEFNFTKYLLEQTSQMKSYYSVRLYELLVQWRTAMKTPLFELKHFRSQLGLTVNQYKAMNDFKKRVLEPSIKEINEKSDLKVSYSQEKQGRKIIGFKFTIKPKPQKKNATRDPNTLDWFSAITDKENQQKWKTKGLSQSQINRLSVKVRADKLISDNILAIEKLGVATYGRDTKSIFEELKVYLTDPTKLQNLKGIQACLDLES